VNQPWGERREIWWDGVRRPRYSLALWICPLPDLPKGHEIGCDPSDRSSALRYRITTRYPAVWLARSPKLGAGRGKEQQGLSPETATSSSVSGIQVRGGPNERSG
jgi:hypothetical protein